MEKILDTRTFSFFHNIFQRFHCQGHYENLWILWSRVVKMKSNLDKPNFNPQAGENLHEAETLECYERVYNIVETGEHVVYQYFLKTNPH